MQFELQNHLEEFRRSEELGETRLNIYLTIVTAILGTSGYIVYTGTTGSLETQLNDLWIIFFAFLATLMFGIITLLRMVHRDLYSSQKLRAANRIRRYFVERDRGIIRYLEFPPCDDQPPRKWRTKNGGLVMTVLFLNSFLMAIMLALLAKLTSLYLELNSPLMLFGSVGLLGFLAAARIQYKYATNEYRNEMKNIRRSSICPSTDSSISKELESAFIIKSDDPKSIAQDIGRLTTIGSYLLLCGPVQHIHDRYFDTKNRMLEKQKIALRIREINDEVLITLKGPSASNGPATQRMEIEEKWSYNAFDRVIKELSCRKIDIALPPEASRNDLPKPNKFERMKLSEIMSVMETYGLKEIQDRETNRTIRNVVTERNGPILAELAIDRVCYHFDEENIEANIAYYEVEIESKFPDDGTDVIRTVGTALQGSYPLFMSEWTSSKLGIGKVIKEIFKELKEGDFLENIDNKKSLKPSYSLKPIAFERIEQHIRDKLESPVSER